MMKKRYAKIVDGVVVQVQPHREPGFIQVNPHVWPGMLERANGNFENPPARSHAPKTDIVSLLIDAVIGNTQAKATAKIKLKKIRNKK